MRPPASTSPLPPNIPGSRCFSASSARRADCELVSGDATATKPPTDSRVIDANAPSNSSTVAAGTMWSWTASFPRAASNSLNTGGCEGVVGFQRTPIKIGANGRQPRGISTGSREARHVPDADGIGMGVEHDGDRPGRLPGRLDHRRRGSDDDVDVHADQFGCEVTQLLDALRPAELDDNALALDVAEIAQPRPQRFHLARSRGSGGEMQIPDPSNLCRLRARRKRPHRRRAAEQRDELRS